MEKNLLRKTLVIYIIFLFLLSALPPISIGYKIRVEDFNKQTSKFLSNSNIFCVNKNREDNYTSIQDTIKDINSSDFNFCFIFCTIHHIHTFKRGQIIAFNVKLELTDYDTGEIIEQKTCLIGIHLFKFLSLGHNYRINAATPKGNAAVVVRNIGIFHIIEINILIFDY